MLFSKKYPKITVLVLMIFIAYFVFKNPLVQGYLAGLGEIRFLGFFIAGMCFSFGFSAPFAVGFFLLANVQNIYLAALIGGLGAMLSDITIFKLIRVNFQDEFDELKKERFFVRTGEMIDKRLSVKIKYYMLYLFAGFLIASPLPDEFGVTMLAGLTKIKMNILALISFVLNTAGIAVIILLGHV